MLRLDRLHHPVTSLGPGVRAAIWTAGCRKRCPGCISPSLLDERSGALVPVERVAALVLSIRPEPHGLTISGGEPFLQAGSLARLCRLVTASTDMDVMVYSGYTLHELQDSAEARELLACTDILIDGEYRRDEPTELLWRGSANQRLHLLSDRARVRYPDLPRKKYHGARDLGLSVLPDGTFFLTGIPRPGDLSTLHETAASRGLTWRYE